MWHHTCHTHLRSSTASYLPYPSSFKYCVICVVLPEPVSPTTTTTWFSRMTCEWRGKGVCVFHGRPASGEAHVCLCVCVCCRTKGTLMCVCMFVCMCVCSTDGLAKTQKVCEMAAIGSSQQLYISCFLKCVRDNSFTLMDCLYTN